MTLELYLVIDEIADMMRAKGVELPDAIKRRDPKEPGRAMKEQWEDKLFGLVMRRFRIQKKQIKAFLEMMLPAKANFMPMVSDSLYVDEETEAQLLKAFIEATNDGIDLCAETSPIGLDWNVVNTAAADWARTYTTDWLNALDDVTRKALRSQLANFVEVPGYTIGDVVRGMGRYFDEARGLRVAVTEITNIFAKADQLAGEVMQKEFPGVRIVKTWHTNEDDLVCDLCGPLNGVTVGINEEFPDGGGEGPARHVNCRCWRSTTTDILGEV